MPAIDYVYETLAGPVTQTGASGDVATDIGCTATLTAGRWLILGVASHVNITGAGGVTQSSEVEVRHESTRVTISRWSSPFGSFAPSIAAGTTLKVLYVLDALNGDEVSMWLRRENNGNADDGEVRVGDCQLLAINLDLLVEGSDYWYAEGPNSDTAEVTASGATWVSASAAGQLGQGGSQVDFTVPSTGDYWVSGSLNAYITTTSGNTEIAGARLRLDNTSTLGSGESQHITLEGGSPTASVYNFTEEDVLSLTSGATPDIRWEVNNDSSGTSVGFRRSRVFVLRLGALANYSFITNAGNIQTSGGNVTEGANALTFDFDGDTVVTASPVSQPGGGNWGRSWLHEDAGDVRHPSQGRLDVYYNDGSGSADDIGNLKFLELEDNTSHTYRLAQEADGGAGTFTVGRNRGNTATARTVLLAFELATASAGDSHAGSGTLAGVGSLSGAGGLSIPVSGTLAGAGALTGAAVLSMSPTGDVFGTGLVSGIGTLSIASSGSITGVGSLTSTPGVGHRGSGALAGVGSLTGDGSVGDTEQHVGSGTLAGVGSITGLAALRVSGSGDLFGVGSVTGSGTLSVASTGAISGVGLYSGDATLSIAAVGSILGVGSLIGTTNASNAGSGELLGVGSLVGVGRIGRRGRGTLAGVGSLSSTVSIGLAARGSLLGVGALVATPTMHLNGTAELSGVGSIRGNGAVGAVVPSITSISIESGHPTGGYLVEIIGTNFNMPPAAPATGVAPVPGPSMRVEFGGVASRRVAVISPTRMMVVVPKHQMPMDANGRTSATALVDITLVNLDIDGSEMGAATLEDAFIYRRPDVSGEQPSYLTMLIRHLIMLLRGEVTAEVIAHQSTDYDSDVSTLVVDSARLPQVILSGPQIERNGVYTDGVGGRVSLSDPLEFRNTRRPYYCDLKFDVLLITNSEMHLLNLISLITTVVDRNSRLEVSFGSGTGTTEFPLDWDEHLSVSRQTSQLNSNIKVARGSFTITGFPFVEIPGTENDATQSASMQTADVPSLQPAEQVGDNLPSYQGRTLRSPGPRVTGGT